MKSAENNRREMVFTSFGGNGGLVTGSCHMLQRGNEKVLVDFGIFQGRDEILNKKGELRNLEYISEIGRGLSSVLYTHVHMDHGGNIPLLYEEGFTPDVFTLEATKIFSEIMWEDSVKIQQKESKKTPPLYTQKGKDLALRHTHVIKPFTEFEIGSRHSKITAEFIPNGHVIGSASVLVRDSRLDLNLLFTGDMGKPHQLLCGGYEDLIPRFPDEPIKAMFVESTCFEGEPITFDQRRYELLDSITETWDRGGIPLLTTLSFHRSHELIEILHNFQETNELPDDCEIIIDAPLAIELLEVFKELGPKYLGNNFGDILDFYKTEEDSRKRFDLKNLKIVKTHNDSKMMAKTLARCGKNVIIIASGGMGNKGRSINYLGSEFNQNPNNSVIFTCYQVSGTPGAELKNQPDNPKKARKIFLNGNTSHISGSEQTFEYLERYNLTDLGMVIIGHGKDPARKSMAKEFQVRGYEYTDILTPKIGQRIVLPA